MSVADADILLVQFTVALTEPDMARLHDGHGLTFDRYLPENSYVERVSAARGDALGTDFLVAAAQPLPAAMKLNAALDGEELSDRLP